MHTFSLRSFDQTIVVKILAIHNVYIETSWQWIKVGRFVAKIIGKGGS